MRRHPVRKPNVDSDQAIREIAPTIGRQESDHGVLVLRDDHGSLSVAENHRSDLETLVDKYALRDLEKRMLAREQISQVSASFRFREPLLRTTSDAQRRDRPSRQQPRRR